MKNQNSPGDKLQSIIRKVRKIESIGRVISAGKIAGEYKSIFRGNGIEFDQVRDYTDQDDSRLIDWNVTARLNQPFVKTFQEERDLNIYFLVDVSASENFSSGIHSKREITAEIAAVIGINAISRNDKLGLLLFSDKAEVYIPPSKRRQVFWRILREILCYSPESRNTSIAEALAYFSRIKHVPGIIFVVSDFFDEGYEPLIRRLAQRNSVILIKVTDQAEHKIPKAGIIEFEDMETGEIQLVDTSDFQWQEKYAAEMQNKSPLLSSKSIDYLEIRTSENASKILKEFFHYKAIQKRFRA